MFAFHLLILLTQNPPEIHNYAHFNFATPADTLINGIF